MLKSTTLGPAVLFVLSLLLVFTVGCTDSKNKSSKGQTGVAQKAPLYQCPMHPQITSHRTKQSCPICGMNLVLVETDEEPAPPTKDHSAHAHSNPQGQQKVGATTKSLYQCPMHPKVTSRKKNQTCSVCGMDLVGVQSDKAESAGSSGQAQPTELSTHAPFKLSMKKMQMIGVQKQKVVKKVLFKKIKAAGSIAYDPELFTASSEYQEALKQYLRQKNSPLVEIKQSARETLRAAKIRLKVLGLSNSQIKAINPYKSLSEDLLITNKNKKPLIYADVYESDLPFIKPGQSVEVSASFLQGRAMTGKVQSVDRIINRETRTARVRILLNTTTVQVRPDSYVDVVIYSPVGEHLSVPFDAVLDTGLQAIVFVVKDQGRFEPRKVLISMRAGNDLGIGSGVKEGEEVVTSANFLIDSESRLRAVIREASKGSNHAD